MNLIETLIQQHTEMRSLSDSIRNISISKEEKLEIFIKLKNILGEHRNLEDTKLYPLLFETAKNDIYLQRKLDVFAKDWEQVSALSKQFLQKYSENLSGEDFNKEAGKFFANLKTRTMKEEVGLFPEYNKIIKTQK